MAKSNLIERGGGGCTTKLLTEGYSVLLMYSFNSWCHHPPRLHTKRWNNNCNCTSHYLFILGYLNVIAYFSFIRTFRDEIHVQFISVKPNSSSNSNRTSKPTHKNICFISHPPISMRSPGIWTSWDITDFMFLLSHMTIAVIWLGPNWYGTHDRLTVVQANRDLDFKRIYLINL